MSDYPLAMVKGDLCKTVHNALQERAARLEGFDFPKIEEYAEYPKILTHKKDRARTQLVHSLEQEADAVANGFVTNGKGDREAFVRQKASPVAGYVPVQFPKWVLGRIVNSADEEAAALAAAGK